MNIKPTLVLLPGLEGTGELFAPLLQALNPNIQTVVMQYPTTGIMDYEHLTKLAKPRIPKNRPYILLGESFSGPIAIKLAAGADRQLKGVILACTFAKNPRPLLSKLGVLLPPIEASDVVITFLDKFLMGNFINPEVSTMLKNALTRVSPITIRARLEEVMAVDYSLDLADIKVPILYLRGAHDKLVPALASELILKIGKHVQMIEFDAPHLLLQLTPTEAAKAIDVFIKNLDKQPSIKHSLK